MKLTEVFDQPYALSEPQVNLRDDGFGSVEYFFHTDSDNNYTVTFSTNSPTTLMVEFSNEKKMGLSGTGNEFRVFATVVESCRRILKLLPYIVEISMCVVTNREGMILTKKRFYVYTGIIRKIVPSWIVNASNPRDGTMFIDVKIPKDYVR